MTQFQDAMKVRYRHEKISAAVRRLVLHEDEDALADAFALIKSSDDFGLPLPPGEAKDWHDELLAMIAPSPADLKKGVGGYLARAEGFTPNERIDFARLLWELYDWLTSVRYGAAPFQEDN